ncbi:MAG: PhzF family phenazine biosynthesis protein [Rickettsiales bacterium]|nr:PhzF family phenazine biosynthesis protein [Rickettsiales bacterium]
MHLERRTHSFSPLAGWNEDMEAIVKSFQIDTSLVVEILRTVELNDLIFVLNNSITLRKMKPNFKEMAIILEKLDIRNLCATALGDQDKFDFETRIFIPHDNLNEDLACGSSSLAIASYWNKKIDKDNFTVLFPYHMEHPDGKIGGVQFIKILDDRTMVGGYCDSISQDSKTVNYTVQHSLLYSNLAN